MTHDKTIGTFSEMPVDYDELTPAQRAALVEQHGACQCLHWSHRDPCAGPALEGGQCPDCHYGGCEIDISRIGYARDYIDNVADELAGDRHWGELTQALSQALAELRKFGDSAPAGVRAAEAGLSELQAKLSDELSRLARDAEKVVAKARKVLESP